jgi:hypothetical protein
MNVEIGTEAAQFLLGEHKSDFLRQAARSPSHKYAYSF